jgi:hypothetical protein
MKIRFILGVTAVFLFASVLRADDVTVTVAGADWQQIAPNTFVLPADLTTGIVFCGSENEPECEPLGVFTFNVALAGVPNLSAGQQPVSFAVLDPSGSVSDLIGVGNLNGNGVLFFASDPLPVSGISPVGVLCTEGADGCVWSGNVSTTTGSTFTLTLAFDGENPSDPLGAGFDTSDGLKVSTPEPDSLALLACSLAGLAGILHNRLLPR